MVGINQVHLLPKAYLKEAQITRPRSARPLGSRLTLQYPFLGIPNGTARLRIPVGLFLNAGVCMVER